MIQAITQNRLETTLARYVAMPTVTDDVEACSDAIKILAAEFAALGLTTHTDGPTHPWLIATTTPQSTISKHVKILFVIHFDVVPFASDIQHTLQITDGKLFGRGVYDMKFAAACVKEMLVDFAEQGNLEDYNVGVLITTDEEKGGYNGVVEFLEHGWRCDLAVIPDGGYNWTVERRSKGIAYLYLTAYGKAMHSSRPWSGNNPIQKIAPALNSIMVEFTNQDPDGVVVSINSLTTSNAAISQTTQTPSWVRAGISVRAFTSEETSRAIHRINQIAQEHDATVETTLNEPPVHLMTDNALVKTFIAAASEIHGAPVEFSDALGASDARHFAKYDIPTVLMYPNGGGHHGPHEWIVQNDLFKFYQLCKLFTERAGLKASSALQTAAR